jgi:Tol biopolymer transport system component
MKILGSADGQGYWHSTATQDLKWAAGDNVTGDCMDLINIKTGEKTTLITNLYQGKGISNKTHSHHRFSPDGTHLLVSSAMLGSADIFTVAIPPVLRGEAKK